MSGERKAFAVVANPAARSGRVGRRLTELQTAVRAALGDVTWHLTERPGHARELAAFAAQTGRIVVAMGGDGTVSEVVGGVVAAMGTDAQQVEVALLPAGTGGDFRRLLQARTWQAALAAARWAPSRPIDVGRLRVPGKRDTHFVNIASFGLGGLVDERVNSGANRLGGRLGFFAASISAMRVYAPARVAIRVDGLHVGDFDVTNVAVANGRFFAGGMCAAPTALLDDGALDVVVLPAWPLHRALWHTPAMYRGEILSAPGVVWARGQRIEAEIIARTAWLDVDGEPLGPIPAQFECVPRAIRFVGISDSVCSPA